MTKRHQSSYFCSDHKCTVNGYIGGKKNPAFILAIDALKASAFGIGVERATAPIMDADILTVIILQKPQEAFVGQIISRPREGVCRGG